MQVEAKPRVYHIDKIEDKLFHQESSQHLKRSEES